MRGSGAHALRCRQVRGSTSHQGRLLPLELLQHLQGPSLLSSTNSEPGCGKKLALALRTSAHANRAQDPISESGHVRAVALEKHVLNMDKVFAWFDKLRRTGDPARTPNGISDFGCEVKLILQV